MTNSSEIKELMPFRDKYFEGLGAKDIAELAKKSVRIMAENMAQNFRFVIWLRKSNINFCKSFV